MLFLFLLLFSVSILQPCPNTIPGLVNGIPGLAGQLLYCGTKLYSGIRNIAPLIPPLTPLARKLGNAVIDAGPAINATCNTLSLIKTTWNGTTACIAATRGDQEAKHAISDTILPYKTSWLRYHCNRILGINQQSVEDQRKEKAQRSAILLELQKKELEKQFQEIHRAPSVAEFKKALQEMYAFSHAAQREILATIPGFNLPKDIVLEMTQENLPVASAS